MTPRRFAVICAVVAALLLGALAFFMGLPSDRDVPAPDPVASGAPAPSPVPSGEGDPGAPIRDGLVVVPGSKLVEAPGVKESAAVSGWFANLDLTGEPAAVLAGYRSQLEDQGYSVVRDGVVPDGPAAGTFSLEAHRTGLLPGAAAPSPVDVVLLDVVPSGAVPGYVRLMVTHLEG